MNELYISTNRTQEEIKKKFKKRTHIVAVNANYSGPLRKGEFQLSFGGNTINSDGNTGFLVPQSGSIKRVEMLENILGKSFFEVEKLLSTGTVFSVVLIRDGGRPDPQREVYKIGFYKCKKEEKFRNSNIFIVIFLII